MEEQGREAEAEAGAGSRQEGGDKEAEPSRKGGRVLNPSFSGRGRTFLPWREKGKVKTVVYFVFSFVDQLLTRSLGLEKLPNKQQNFEILFLQINLVVKDQTTYH